MTELNFEHLPNYLDLADGAEELGANTGLAEAHGVLVGLACGTAELRFERWYEEVFEPVEEDDHLAQRYAGEMQALFDTTVAMLADEGVSFVPMLPDTDSRLSDRADALGQWCRGFAYAVSLSAFDPARTLSHDSQELLGDFAAIARAGHEDDEDGSEDEAEMAYAELEEYVRVGVLLIREELVPLVAATQQTLH